MCWTVRPPNSVRQLYMQRLNIGAGLTGRSSSPKRKTTVMTVDQVVEGSNYRGSPFLASYCGADQVQFG